MKLLRINRGSVIFFFLVLSSAVYWNIGVQIVFIEIVSVVALFLIVVRNIKSINQVEFNSEITWVIRLFWVWLLTQIFVDLYINSEIFESLKTF